MLRNIFPDEPVSDQDNSRNAEDPGTFFSEFLPSGIKTGSHSHHKKSAAAAAAAAKASAAEATAAAQQMASRAAQHAKVADKAAAEAQQGEIPANSLIPEAPVDSGSEDGILPDLPSISELKSVATACFGADSDAEASTAAAAGKRAGKEAEAAAEGEDDSEEGLLEKLLPSFGKDSCLRKKTSQLVPTFRSGRQKAKPKPLRLKLAEQVLSKELLAAVQIVESEILSSADPLPSATIKFFLKAGRSMGSGWARQNATRVFGFLTAYVGATCGIMHGVKAAAKWLAWRIPRVGKRVAGPAVSFTADVLLPTPFLGPTLATYLIIMLLIKPSKSDSNADVEASEATAATAAAAALPDKETEAAAAGAAAAAAAGSTQQRPREAAAAAAAARAVEHSRSRELQLELIVDEPASARRARQQLRGRRPLARVSSIKGRVRNRMVERAAVSADGRGAAAIAEEGEEEGEVSVSQSS